MLFVFLGGCATTEYHPLPPDQTAGKTKAVQTQITDADTRPKTGFYHKVVKSQTLFRIAKAYGVTVEDIIKANNIPNAAAIEVNQLILIPGAIEARPVSVQITPDENKDEFAWPIKGKVISYFNDRRGDYTNRGIDIEVNEGDLIKACREGVVIMADYMAGYGQTLMIDHGDGFISVYAENRKLLSKVGDHVLKADPIAEAGKSGKKSFIHLELRKAQKAINPLYYLP